VRITQVAGGLKAAKVTPAAGKPTGKAKSAIKPRRELKISPAWGTPNKPHDTYPASGLTL
ncbi:hypothetical protein L0F63_004220, partial [Massospora cicadina]